MTPALTPVGIALGSNLGDRAAEIEAGFAFLRSLAAQGAIRRSAVVETLPVDCPPGSASFLNAVAEIEVDPQVLAPLELHARLKQFELERGRPREHARHAPRALDLDLLYFGELVLDSPELVIPHPRAAQRRFVLVPLAELRPGMRLPGQVRTIRELLDGDAPARSGLQWGMLPNEKQIQELAYHLWEKEGRPEGRAVVTWFQAERLISDDSFLKQEIEVEEEEGGLAPEN